MMEEHMWLGFTLFGMKSKIKLSFRDILGCRNLRRKMKKLVNSNYMWRVIFTFMVVLSHYPYIDHSNASYYIGVDYFFIFSGLMIAYSIEVNGKVSVFEFTYKRIKKLYPHIWFSFFAFYGFLCIGDSAKSIIAGMIGYLYQIIPMMYYVLPNNCVKGYLNFPVWYISVMLIDGLVVYYLYSKHKSFCIYLVSPTVVLSGWYFFVHNSNSFNNGATLGLFTNVSYIRGFTDMFCGIILYRMIIEIKKIKFTKVSYIVFRVTELLSFVVLCYALRKYGNSCNDIYFVLIICIIIVASFIYEDEQAGLFSKFKKINDFMYPVYLNHLFCIYVASEMPQYVSLVKYNKLVALIVYFIALLIYSFITMKLLALIQVLIHKTRRLFINDVNE